MLDALQVIRELVREPERAGLVMDFDGVLSPIISDPNASVLLDGNAELLESIARRLGVVALLSGRSLEFLAERAGVPGVLLLGSYGLQEMHGDLLLTHPEAEPWLGAVQDATRRLHELFDPVEGVWVEDKSLSVAIHWRRVPEGDRASVVDSVEQAVADIGTAIGLSREPGKFVEELRPPVAYNKGDALSHLLDEGKADRVAYVGDDLGDVPALGVAAARGGFALVVYHGSETRKEVRDAAQILVPGVEKFQGWLRELNSALRAR